VTDDGSGCATASIRIGTSGWQYAHWVGPFYPPGTSTASFLAYYSQVFRAAEINSTFCGLPSKRTLATWRDATPTDFVFACEASRYITHMKKLTDPKSSTKCFIQAIDDLGEKCGSVLFQLPPRWNLNLERLTAFLNALPKGYRYAFEFRDER
jgi:uncharacterized protein YecE (DUF72 family)